MPARHFERPSLRGGGAFSLVEVAISLGIISFALLSLLALLTTSLDAGKESKEDTNLASMTQMVISDLRAQPFASATDKTYYFDAQGQAVADPTLAYYECRATLSASSLPEIAGGLVEVELVFAWPRSAAVPHQRTLHASLASY